MLTEGPSMWQDGDIESLPTNGRSVDLWKLATGGVIILVGIVLGRGVTYFFNVYIARILGSEPYGIYSLGLYIFNMAATISIIGMNTAVIRYVALYRGINKYDKVKGTVLGALFLVLPISILAAVILFFQADTLAVKLFHEPRLGDVLRIFGIGIPFINASTIFVFATQGFQMMKYRVYIKNIIEPIGKLILGATFLAIGWGLRGVLWAFVLTLILASFLSYRYFLKAFSQFRAAIRTEYNLRELLIFSGPLMFVGIFQVVIDRIDALMLGHFRSPHEVGLYCAAFQTAMLVGIARMSLSAIFAPMISDIYNKRQFSRLEPLLKIATRWVFTLSFPAVLLMFFFLERSLDCLVINSKQQARVSLF